MILSKNIANSGGYLQAVSHCKTSLQQFMHKNIFCEHNDAAAKVVELAAVNLIAFVDEAILENIRAQALAPNVPLPCALSTS